MPESSRTKGNHKKGPRIREYRQQKDFHMRNQCDSLWEILLKKGHDNGNSPLQQNQQNPTTGKNQP